MNRQATVLALGVALALASAAPGFAQDQIKTHRHSAAQQQAPKTNPYTGYYDYDRSGDFAGANSGSMGSVGR
jgi:hypothetical protein